MSMMLTPRRVTEADIAALRADPDEVIPMLHDVDGLEGVAAEQDRTAMERAIASVDRDYWADHARGANNLWWIAAAVLEHLRMHAPPAVSKPAWLDLDTSGTSSTG